MLPEFHFTYGIAPGVKVWRVKVWPGTGMYWHFLGLGLLAVLIACGCFYRVATLLFAIGFTYFFLLERTNYQNHYYLITILSWSLVFLSLHRNAAVDVWRRPGLHSTTIPAWCLWLTRFHVGIPYVYGGLAKLTPDWLLGEPMSTMLMGKSTVPIVGDWLAQPGMGLLFSYGGLLFDLAIVPCLMWRRTRVVAYFACVTFHVTNAMLFHIHVFPWMMILASTVFFEPDWPMRLWRKLTAGTTVDSAVAADELVVCNQIDREASVTGTSGNWLRRCLFGCLVVHIGFQLLFPFRHLWLEGDPSWTERGHLFAWRMMLRGKTGGVRYFVTDRQAGRTSLVDLRGLLSEEQAGKFPRDPWMVVQLARQIGELEQRLYRRQVEVRALVLLSLNGRKPQLLIDPNQDLLALPDPGWWPPRACPAWILPNREPLRGEPWMVPLVEWERHVEIPELQFLRDAPLGSTVPPAEN